MISPDRRGGQGVEVWCSRLLKTVKYYHHLIPSPDVGAAITLRGKPNAQTTRQPRYTVSILTWLLMLPSWLVIGIMATLIAVATLKLNTTEGMRWFNRQQRPQWLTFERLIPFIWSSIFICGAWSAYITWEAEPHSIKTWSLMFLYALTEIVIMAYNPVMAWFKSLKAGVWVGGMGFGFGLVLAILVAKNSVWAALLLVPYLLWSPIGTYVTWVMAKINRPQRRS